MNIGILAFHGDVIEHLRATQKALTNINQEGNIIEVRSKNDIPNLDALIIPGGESTVLHRLSRTAGIFETLKNVRNIFGTCAGAIMLAKYVQHKSIGQETLGVMDITVDRNAYGRQTNSFEKNVNSVFGELRAVFIRAPKITKVGNNVKILSRLGNEIIACEQTGATHFYMAACFHPELTTTKFHEYFLKSVKTNRTGKNRGNSEY